ncbi:hypothetical protein NQ318_000169 [Aromia moschata]|uniref:Uncharacterized protein n=1 Tax=Aromia moschata TaxID=1265417 RepID=A0AAV8YJI3_9CUCU|nr:hypothetical protein NQ318_000169 [Aromia moschata]
MLTIYLANLNISQENNVSQRDSSRRESLSSISVESLGSIEAEQALLEQCISSGMPKESKADPQEDDGEVVQPRSDRQPEEDVKPKT